MLRSCVGLDAASFKAGLLRSVFNGAQFAIDGGALVHFERFVAHVAHDPRLGLQFQQLVGLRPGRRRCR